MKLMAHTELTGICLEMDTEVTEYPEVFVTLAREIFDDASSMTVIKQLEGVWGPFREQDGYKLLKHPNKDVYCLFFDHWKGLKPQPEPQQGSL